jgi:hypothetical protein
MLEPQAERAGVIAGGCRLLGSGSREFGASSNFAATVEGVDEVDGQRDLGLASAEQRERSPEELRCGGHVRAGGGAASGGVQSPPRLCRQLGRRGLVELAVVAAGLFEVVAEQLVELDELRGVVGEPGGEAPV